jgi:hypothetical protein
VSQLQLTEVNYPRILGYSISDEHNIDGGRQSNFEKGHITWLQESVEITFYQ